MSLLEHLKEAARHLKEATQMARDWRVRDAVGNAGTVVGCAVHIQEKIAAGKDKVETRPAFERGASSVERET